MSINMPMDDSDDDWIEDEIQRELAALTPADLEQYNNNNEIELELTQTDGFDRNDSEPDLPSSVLDYMKQLQTHHRLEEDLVECDDLLLEAEKVSKLDVGHKVDLLIQDVSEEHGVEPAKLREQILNEIEAEEKQELARLQQADSVNHENPEVGKDGAAPDQESNGAAPESFQGGVVAIPFESDALEIEALKKLRDLTERLKMKEEQQKKLEEETRQNEQKISEEKEKKRQQKIQELKQEEYKMEKQRQVQNAVLEAELQKQQEKQEKDLRKYETEIQTLAEQTQKEQVAFQQACLVQQQREEEQRHLAAARIQAGFRGHRIRKTHMQTLKQKKEQRHKEMEQVRLKQVEAERAERNRKDQERKEKIEEEKRRKEEEKRIKEEEEKRKKEEQERKKKEMEEWESKMEEKKREEERRKHEEEQKRLEQERRKEEDMRKQEEERKNKEEEERRRLEEERKREEERLIEERKREEAERIKQEELRKEEEKQKQEELRKKEEERKKQEELRMEEERRKIEEENRKKEEVEKEAKQKLDREKHQTQPVNHESNLNTNKSNSTISNPKFMQFPSSFPEDVEKTRQAWVKESVSWRQTIKQLNSRTLPNPRKPPRRPNSAKKLTPLSEDVICKAAQLTALKQVTTAELQDLPGCSLNTLSQCPRLKALSMRNCGVVVLDGLEGCKELEYLDMKDNKIEMLNLKDFASKLIFLDVSQNSLSTIHGLEGGSDIRFLDLAKNRITRLSNLSHLTKLHTLNMSHNQLISTKGLNEVPTVQELNLSHNHLSRIEDISELGLLRKLEACGNNITELPNLRNQILLQILLLDDNSICDLQSLADTWLPMLDHLSMRENSLTDISLLNRCTMLNKLDLSNNQILDADSLVPGLMQCNYLTQLSVEGNPVDESDYRTKLLQTLPRLVLLDETSVQPTVKPPVASEFEMICRHFIEMHQKMYTQFQMNVESQSNNTLQLLKHHQDYALKTFTAAVDLRYFFEDGKLEGSLFCNGDVIDTLSENKDNNISENSKINMNSNNTDYAQASQTSVINNKSVYSETLVITNHKSTSAEQSSQAATSMSNGPTTSSVVSASVVGKQLEEEGIFKKGHSIQDLAATKIQSCWKGYAVRRDIDNHARMWIAATVIQNKWRNYRKKRRYKHALQYAKMNDSDEEWCEEVDVSAFDFDAADLDKDWAPPKTPMLAERTPVLGKPPVVNPGERIQLWEKVPHPPSQPKEAWQEAKGGQYRRGVDSPVHVKPPASPFGRPPLPPPSSMSGSLTSRTATSKHSKHSAKTEELSEEWGFKDTRTAELMLKRANKLKYNAERKKKLSKMDPRERLALFRRHEGDLRPVQPPARKGLQRKEYFRAREEETARQNYEKHEEEQSRVLRTYQWLHSQDETRKDSPPENQTIRRVAYHGSDSNLPYMNAEVLNGGRASLVSSPVSVELRSIESGSIHGHHSPSPSRRHSASEDRNRIELPAIKTNSTPSMRVKERISWRNPEINKSSGWGGGKKRNKKM